MKAEVRRFISPDIDLRDFRPEDPDTFSFLLQVLVGPVGGEGEESLQFVVCTPSSLQRRTESEGPILGRSLVVTCSTDISKVMSTIARLIGAIEQPSWALIVNRLARYATYEFEDFI